MLQGRADRRNAILKEVEAYQKIHDRKTVPLTSLQPLLANISSYLLGESEQDEFGDVEDEDLMLAESTDLVTTSASTKRATSSDFDDIASSKRLRGDDDAASIALAEGILKKTWGFPHFRLKQQQAITRLINGGSAVVVFPTGGGKSLVYQVPALAFNDHDKHCGRSPGGGLTLVVSPLIALMKVGFCGLPMIRMEMFLIIEHQGLNLVLGSS